MEQTDRIRYMEHILDKAEEASSALSDALEKYLAVQNELQELRQYYTGENWRRDFDDDSAGKLPTELKRGVLSEDSVHNLLMQNEALRERMKKLLTD